MSEVNTTSNESIETEVNLNDLDKMTDLNPVKLMMVLIKGQAFILNKLARVEGMLDEYIKSTSMSGEEIVKENIDKKFLTEEELKAEIDKIFKEDEGKVDPQV